MDFLDEPLGSKWFSYHHMKTLLVDINSLDSLSAGVERHFLLFFAQNERSLEICIFNRLYF